MAPKFTITPTILQGVRAMLGFEGRRGSAKFAALLGVSPRTYRRYESGEMIVPQPVIRLVWMLHNRGVPKDWRV